MGNFRRESRAIISPLCHRGQYSLIIQMAENEIALRTSEGDYTGRA